jgi:hypothetical protein
MLRKFVADDSPVAFVAELSLYLDVLHLQS